MFKRETYRSNLGLADQIFDAALRATDVDDEDLPAINPIPETQ